MWGSVGGSGSGGEWGVVGSGGVGMGGSGGVWSEWGSGWLACRHKLPNIPHDGGHVTFKSILHNACRPFLGMGMIQGIDSQPEFTSQSLWFLRVGLPGVTESSAVSVCVDSLVCQLAMARAAATRRPKTAPSGTYTISSL